MTRTAEVRVRVTKALHARLKEKARSEHRSLGAQLQYMLEQIVPAETAGAKR